MSLKRVYTVTHTHFHSHTRTHQRHNNKQTKTTEKYISKDRCGVEGEGGRVALFMSLIPEAVNGATGLSVNGKSEE